MKKDKIIAFRGTQKTYERINNIRKQMIAKGFEEDMLSDSYIIREAIRVYEDKLKYLIYDIEIKK